MSKMKKKLFIAGAYLIVAVLLLIYVSYSAYRITIDASIQFPKAYEIQAGLKLNYDLSTATKSDASAYGVVLKNISPGEDASAYSDDPADAADKGRELVVQVANYSSPSEATHGNVSALAQDYTISLHEVGPIPIEVYLVDEQGNKYIAKTETSDTERTVYFATSSTATASDASVFHLNAIDEEINEYKLYFGWNNDNGSAQPSYLIKEIAIISIKVDTVMLPPEVIVINTPESDYTDKIDGFYTDKELATPAGGGGS